MSLASPLPIPSYKYFPSFSLTIADRHFITANTEKGVYNPISLLMQIENRGMKAPLLSMWIQKPPFCNSKTSGRRAIDLGQFYDNAQ